MAADGSQIWTPVMSAPMTIWNQMASQPSPFVTVQQQGFAKSMEANAADLDAQAAKVAVVAKRAKARKLIGSDRSGKTERSFTESVSTRGSAASASSAASSDVTSCAGSCDAQVHDSDDRTTLMFRNLPNSYNRAALLNMLDSEGFQRQCSFVYLPTDFNNFAGFGYAFVGFQTHASAEMAKRHFQGFTKWKVPSQKICDVAWSGEVQGNNAYVEKYRNSPVMHDSVPDEYKPALFVNGLRVPFPAPSKRIRPPRVRHTASA